MAGLLGAISNFQMTETKIDSSFRRRDYIISMEHQEKIMFLKS
jgi:hypothetical protein